MREKYATLFIQDLEKKVENELFPAAFRICRKIEKEGKKEREMRLKQYISTQCPLTECTILNGDLASCPNHLCWVAEGPSWQEFLIPEFYLIYSILMDTYLEALTIDDSGEEITLRESPVNVFNQRLKNETLQNLILKSFEESDILKLRTSIIKDVLWAHNQRRYTLSVPLLIIQIEGILHDLAHHFKWEFQEKEMYAGESAKVKFIIKKCGDKSFETALKRFYSRDRSEDSPRNLILHGRSLDYGNGKLSAVFFLVLIYLIAFSQMKLQGRITMK